MLQHFETRAQKAVFLALLSALSAATILSVISMVGEVRRPSPGFVVWSNLVVPAIGTSSWPGQRAGVPLRSVLVAADGRAVADAYELRRLVRSLPLGTKVTYVFRRGAETSQVTVPTTTLGWRHVWPAYAGYVVAGLAFLVTGLVAFYFKPSLPAARATLALGTFLGLTLLLALDLFSAFWLERLYFCVESMMPAALLHVALCFPEEKAVVRRHPSLRWLVYLPFVPLAVLQNVLLRRDAEAQLVVNDWVYTLTAAAGITAFVSLVHAFRSASTPRARQQAMVVLGAAAGAAFVPSLALLSITVLGLQLPMNLLAPFFVLYPLSMAYAIARHDLFSVDRYLRLGVVYAALSVALVVPYALLVIAAERWVGVEGRLERGLIPIYLFAAVLLFDPLRARIQSLVDRLFYRQAYSYRGAVEATSRTLASVLDSEVVARTLLSTLIDVMGIEWAVLLVFDRPDGRPTGFGRPPEKLLESLLRFGDDVQIAALAHRIGPLPEVGAELALPVRFREQPVGTLLIGARRSGAPFSDEDLHLLDTLVNQTALALTNARAYELLQRTQANLVEAERMAAVGELAAAVAHGIRNPLAGIRGTAQVMREDVAEQTTVARDLDNILAEADRLDRRVRSILDVARPIEVNLEARDLCEFLRRVTDSVKARLPAGVRLSLDLCGDLPPVAFDAARLTEVVEALIVNAVEAMEGRGAIAVRAALERGDDGAAQVVVSVSDSGPGIPAVALGRVFDLFYTGKRTGTGVGLAIAKRLVERQGGTIAASNAPAGGAVFTLRFPAAAPLSERRA